MRVKIHKFVLGAYILLDSIKIGVMIWLNIWGCSGQFEIIWDVQDSQTCMAEMRPCLEQWS